MPTKKPRITAIVKQEVKDQVKAIATVSKTSESVVAGKLLEDGLESANRQAQWERDTK